MRRVLTTLFLLATAAGCSSPLTTREKGAIAGGAIGAGAGAVVGNQVGHTAAGALIGAGVGVVSGALIGDAIQSSEQKSQQAATPPPPPPPPPPPQQVVVVSPPPTPSQVIVVSPPPVVTGTPRFVWVPAWQMYVMETHDVVYHGNLYYYFHASRWWSAASYAGPWVIVSTVPAAIAALPPGHLHAHVPGGQWCPPGQAKKGRC